MCSRLRGEPESRPGRRASILTPAVEGKLRPAAALSSNLRRGKSSGQASAARRAHSRVNQTTSAVWGRDSSMAEVEAQVWGMSAGTRTRS